MKRFLIKKLIVISDKESKSKEINFDEGLNIILGKNKTGKSSLIKSIFHCLGCEVKMESSWKNIIDLYLLQFKYGEDTFEVVRRGKEFRIIQKTEHLNRLLIDTSSFHDFCNCLTLEVFKIEFPLITKSLKAINVTTPVLWRFQYIDQDSGWSKIGESFTNMKYILNWKEFSNKYVIGYQDEKFYQLKKKNNLSKEKIKDDRSKLKHYEELLNHINSSIEIFETPKNINENLDVLKSLFQELEELAREKVLLQEKLSISKNLLYEKRLSFKMLKNTIQELENDHKFALDEDEEITCPFCGTNHVNGLLERTEIIKDIQTGNKLVGEFRKELKNIESDITDFKNKVFVINRKIKRNENLLEREKDGQSTVNKYRNEGKREFIEISTGEKNNIMKAIDLELVKINGNDILLKNLTSRKRANAIRSEFKIIYSQILDKLNVPHTFLKLKDFVQVLSNTGSELPRIIYAYHIALYLYNLEKERGIFNWLVVDTPNQQGQDDENLVYIDAVMNEVLGNEGQFILGTERSTGFEGRANKLIQLEGERETLNFEKYKEHKEYIKEILLVDEILEK